MKTFLIAAAAVLGACSASASETFLAAEATPFADSMACDVLTTPTRHGVRFEAIAFSPGEAFGEYEFVISKRDRGGVSDIVQGGEFSLLAGESQALGEAEFSIERGGAYEARLTLRDADGLACEAEARR